MSCIEVEADKHMAEVNALFAKVSILYLVFLTAESVIHYGDLIWVTCHTRRG